MVWDVLIVETEWMKQEEVQKEELTKTVMNQGNLSYVG